MFYFLMTVMMTSPVLMELCVFVLQVEALQAQMEEQTRLAREQTESLLEDRRIQAEEAQVQRKRDEDSVAALTDKCVHTPPLLRN